jgi:hypothetical protein
MYCSKPPISHSLSITKQGRTKSAPLVQKGDSLRDARIVKLTILSNEPYLLPPPTDLRVSDDIDHPPRLPPNRRRRTVLRCRPVGTRHRCVPCQGRNDVRRDLTSSRDEDRRQAGERICKLEEGGYCNPLIIRGQYKSRIKSFSDPPLCLESKRYKSRNCVLASDPSGVNSKPGTCRDTMARSITASCLLCLLHEAYKPFPSPEALVQNRKSLPT